MSKNNLQIKAIQHRLKHAYPHIKTQLVHETPFQLLIATILSAQCTDKQVNAVTGPLFEQLASPEKLAAAPLQIIERLIHSTGFYRNKAKNIKNCARALLENHQGKVPKTLDALVQLTGVGRKTANVVLGAAFGVPGIVVDTHVARLAKKIGLTKNTNPVKIEFDLMAIIPKANWNDFSLYLVYHGRAVCKARKPACAGCILLDLCNFGHATMGHKSLQR